MMFATLPAVSRRPLVSTWNRITITRRAMKMPIWRRRDARNVIASRPMDAFSVLASDMVGFLLLGHVVHELFGGGLVDGHLAGDAPFREGVDAVADAEELGQ